MKFRILFALLTGISALVSAQSKTTEALHKKNEEAFALFFYNNTLRMLNQKDDAEFDALIKDIEKMKFLMIEKNPATFNYKAVVKDYKSEAFEEVMTSRFEGKSFDIFIKEKDGKTKGMLVLVNDSASFYVLDIMGSIALNKVTKLYSTLEQSSDIGKRIKALTDHGKDSDRKHE
jgi:hypothetical protein